MASTSPRGTPGLAAADAFIEAHYARPVSVARLARVAGLTPWHFIRAFRAHFGTTPHQRLRDRRIARAQHLLATTPMPVTQVSAAVGFRSLGSFSRIFKHATGASPSAFRARRRRPVTIPSCFVRMYRAGRA